MHSTNAALHLALCLAVLSSAPTAGAERLHEAAAKDRNKEITDFLAAGDAIDGRDSSMGDTALLVAVRQGNGAHNACGYCSGTVLACMQAIVKTTTRPWKSPR